MEKHPWSLSPINSPLSHPQGLRVFLQVPEEYHLFGNDYSLVGAYWHTYRQCFDRTPVSFPAPPPSPDDILEALGHLFGFHLGDGTATEHRVMIGAHGDTFVSLLERAASRLAMRVRYSRITRPVATPGAREFQFTSLGYFVPAIAQPGLDCARLGLPSVPDYGRPALQERFVLDCRDVHGEDEASCLAALPSVPVCTFSPNHHPLLRMMGQFLYKSPHTTYKGVLPSFYSKVALAPAALSRGLLQGLADSDGTLRSGLKIAQTSNPVSGRGIGYLEKGLQAIFLSPLAGPGPPGHCPPAAVHRLWQRRQGDADA